MHPLKAPGPDGLPVLFFQEYWHIVGKDITDLALGILNDACNLNSSNSRENGTVSDANDKWSPPKLGFVKVNIDAGCFNDSYTCWGLLCRDHQGNVQAAATKRERITCSSNLAEDLGLRWCLQWIMDKNLQNVVVEMDSENVVNCILGKLKLVEIEFIIADCLDMLFSLLNVNVVSVKRCKNKVAHGLVGVARSLCSMSWFGNVPQPISSIVFSELLE
ncbi:hypothetical protein P8452_66068 [Trifolium repens]|nr:hypothetical protein P8452_66068 [Trifolium repens]